MIRLSPLKLLPLLLPISLAAVCAVVWLPALSGWSNHPQLLSIKSGFLGILLEALPYVLLGAFLSSLLKLFVPDAWITRAVPGGPVSGSLFGVLLGLLFPVCECGMIPLIRRLMLKGMPLHVAIVFLLSGPIVNPIVFGATMAAFRIRPELAYARMALAAAVSVAVGVMVYLIVRRPPLRLTAPRETSGLHDARTVSGKAAAVFTHTAEEFFEMGKFLIFGCLLTACIQTFMDHGSLHDIGERPLGSYAFMLGLAFVLSLCSTSDAFIASTFLHSFPPGALLAFMVFGPMLDFKNSLMLLSLFKTRFALLLFFLVLCAVFVGSVWLGRTLA